MSGLRVMVIDHVAALSGGELALERLVRALVPEVRVDVVLGEDGPLVERLLDAGARVLVLSMAADLRDVRKDDVGSPRSLVGLPGRGARTAQYAWRLRGVVRRSGADIVQTNSLKAALYGGLAGRLAGRPVVWHVRDRIAADYLPGPAVRMVRALAWAVPDAVVANSAATLATVPGPRRGARAVVHDPLPPAAEYPDSPAVGPYRIGVVGRLAQWKGQDVFLRAFARAFPDGDEVAVLVGSAMFGEDAWPDRLVDLVAELGLSGRVEFRGFREDIPAELARLSVLVHCSVLPEPFGQVIVEGMAAELPVIAAAAGGPLEIVDDEVTGLLSDPGDVQSLAAAMRRLRDDPELADRLASAGRESTSRFAPEKIAAQMIEVYRTMLG